MRTTCTDCAIKHIAQAQVLLDEVALGYPLHKYLAIGHLAEAESELISIYPETATNIRQARILVAADKPFDYEWFLKMLLELEPPKMEGNQGLDEDEELDEDEKETTQQSGPRG